MARRWAIKGSSGAGKSTLAARLADRFSLPHIELDALHHGPNWKEATADELRAKVSALLDDPRGWIVDGNYENKLGGLVLERADLVVWLDLPLRTKLARIARRTAGRMVRRDELWNGNRESLKQAFWGGDSLFVWAVRAHFGHRREWSKLLSARTVVRLRSPREVEAWFASLRE